MTLTPAVTLPLAVLTMDGVMEPLLVYLESVPVCSLLGRAGHSQLSSVPSHCSVLELLLLPCEAAPLTLVSTVHSLSSTNRHSPRRPDCFRFRFRGSRGHGQVVFTLNLLILNPVLDT